MDTTLGQSDLGPLESRTLLAGFVLVGLAIAVTAVSYVSNMTFRYQWLVWGLGAAFAAVALLALEWPRGLRRVSAQLPQGRLRQFLLLAMPLSFMLGSQVCGTGLKGCTVLCHATNLAAIGLAGATAFRVHRGLSLGPTLIPLVVVALVPHCICAAPVNVLWHGVLGGYAPTCGLVPLAATLFSISALRGMRTRASAVLSMAMLGVIVFIAVGNPVMGFPWEGCVG
jgi:hypothetical protein